jgi:cytochrome P450 family 4
MELLTFIAVFVVIVVVWYRKTFYDANTKAMKLPGPPGLPVIGNALLFIGKSPTELLKVLERNQKKYGFITRFAVGPQHMVLLTSPKYVEFILGSQKLITKSNEYDFIAEWLGTGLLISTGQKWFTRRKIITPAFHFKILDQFIEVFDKHSKIFVECLRKHKGQVVDVFPLVTLAALDVICGEF